MNSLVKKALSYLKFFIGVSTSKKNTTLEKSIIFTALNNKYCDNSKYLYEHMRNRGHRVFYVTDSDACTEGVKFGSRMHFSLLKNCSAVCFTHSSRDIATYIPSRIKKINLWHGSPIKKMGFDSPVDLAWLKKYRWLPSKDPYKKWDYITVQSDFFSEAFRSALSFGSEKILLTGLPRNDILYNPKHETRLKVFQLLGVCFDSDIVLYAPTFREASTNITFQCEAIKKIFQTYFPQKTLAIRLHPFDQSGIPDSFYTQNVINANKIEDIQDILQVTNMLITDYSSVAFDYASTNKKIILFCPDREQYEISRGGLYFKLEELPFEYCETLDTLTKLISEEKQYQYYEFGKNGACLNVENFLIKNNLTISNIEYRGDRMSRFIFRSLPLSADSRTSRNASVFGVKPENTYTWELDGLSTDKSQSFPIKRQGRLKKIFFLMYIVWVPLKIIVSAKKNDTVIFMDLETIIIGFFFAKLKGVRIYFDIVDPCSQTKANSPKVEVLFDRLEYFFAKNSSKVIVPHPCRLDFYKDRIIGFKPFANDFIIENVPLYESDAKPTQLDTEPPHRKKTNVGYFGTLDSETRGLEWLIEFSIKNINFINLIIAGQGAMSPAIAELSKKHENIQFLGPFNHASLPKLYDKIDITWAYYSPEKELHRYAAPNKFYEHIYFRKPIIISSIIPHAIEIASMKTGISLDASDFSNNNFELSLKKIEELLRLLPFNEEPAKSYWDAHYSAYYEKISIRARET
ncbi:CDP-glycerol glycerophosphotransferase family protein [Pseudomonas sp. LB3P31]